jgi:hypothetical protein
VLQRLLVTARVLPGFPCVSLSFRWQNRSVVLAGRLSTNTTLHGVFKRSLNNLWN